MLPTPGLLSMAATTNIPRQHNYVENPDKYVLNDLQKRYNFQLERVNLLERSELIRYNSGGCSARPAERLIQILR